MTEPWHGYSHTDRPDLSLHIGPLPGRKRIALYVQEGTVVRSVAFFRDEEAAKLALRTLDFIIFQPRS